MKFIALHITLWIKHRTLWVRRRVRLQGITLSGGMAFQTFGRLWRRRMGAIPVCKFLPFRQDDMQHRGNAWKTLWENMWKTLGKRLENDVCIQWKHQETAWAVQTWKHPENVCAKRQEWKPVKESQAKNIKKLRGVFSGPTRGDTSSRAVRRQSFWYLQQAPNCFPSPFQHGGNPLKLLFAARVSWAQMAEVASDWMGFP